MTHVDLLRGDGHLFCNRIFTREVRGNKFGGALVPREVRGNKFGGVLVQVLGDAIAVVNNNKSPKIHNYNFYHLNLHSILRVKKLRLTAHVWGYDGQRPDRPNDNSFLFFNHLHSKIERPKHLQNVDLCLRHSHAAWRLACIL